MIPLPVADLEAALATGDPLLTIAETAGRLDVDPSTVQSWIGHDWLPCVLVKGRRMVLLSQASEVEHAKRTQPGPKRVRHRDKACRLPTTASGP